MGGVFSRVGSDNFYASYERNFERLKADAAKIRAKAVEGNRRRQKLSATIFWYSCLVFAALFAYAAWVTRQPPGTYTVRGHFMRVVPVFAWPLAAYLLHSLVILLTSWNTRRNDRRLQKCEDKMRKMLTDLKDSTHYDKTLQLLRKYDPEFAATEARQRAKLRLPPSPGQVAPPVTPIQGGVPLSPRKLSGLVGSSIKGAGSRMMPALDYLATSLIGDNPALTNALREAHTEGEALKLRLQRAEARVAELNAINAELRQRLGEPPVPELSLPEPATPTSATAAAAADILPFQPPPSRPSESAAANSACRDGPDGSGRDRESLSDDQPAPEPSPMDVDKDLSRRNLQHALSLTSLPDAEREGDGMSAGEATAEGVTTSAVADSKSNNSASDAFQFDKIKDR